MGARRGHPRRDRANHARHRGLPMMDAREIRGWLLCQPRPVSLRIVSADQQPHVLEIIQGMSWIQAAESVHALQPKLVELFQAVVAKANTQEKTISALDRMVQKLMLEKVAEGTPGEDGAPMTLDSLLQAMMQGKLQAETEKAAASAAGNGKPNGARKPKEQPE